MRKTVTGPGAIDAFAVYDEQRRRIGTYRPDGLGGFTVDEELVYLPDTWRILATVRGQVVDGANGTAWPVLTDHLGAPRAVLDPANGDVRWTWAAREAFGHQAPNETPGSAGAFVFDARFPGQFLDAETGLFHNGYRDYSPQWGRYIQSDPIGLAAGWNTYEYVGGNPVGAYDPLGLEWFRSWDDQTSRYVVGRDGNFFVPPGGATSKFIEHCVPAGRTFGQIHDAKVDSLMSQGIPDYRANIPTMPAAYVEAFQKEDRKTSQEFSDWIMEIFGLKHPHTQDKR